MKSEFYFRICDVISLCLKKDISITKIGCCGVCNHMKYTMNKKDFINKCKQIVTITGYEI
jgi:hypothetical protein